VALGAETGGGDQNKKKSQCEKFVMPASKPAALNVRNDTKADRSARINAESALMPKTTLNSNVVPARLKGHTSASATWKRLIKLYGEIEGTIATSFDQDILVKYCLLEEEVIELEKMRKTMHTDWEDNQKIAKKIKPTPETLKTWVQMWDVVNGMFQRFQGLDARLDGKRKLLYALSQALYLTPRSRAGVAPAERKKEEKDDMGRLLEE